jgi:ankyrin repeat protein
MGDSFGRTALHYAVQRGDEKIAKLLLDASYVVCSGPTTNYSNSGMAYAIRELE